jgi:hypothetical protein
VINVIQRTNPIWDTQSGPEGASPETVNQARQWQIDRISEVKEHVAQALDQKKAYYDNHWMGIITKYVLDFFCMWNNGYTNSITTAEDFLFWWDSRLPIFKSSHGEYETRFFFPLTPVSYIQEKLNTSQFYNYTSEREIIVHAAFDLDTAPSNFRRA